jgi:hypothetical protein
MTTDDREYFAKLLVQEVRDMAIANCDMLLGPNAKGPTANRWRAALASGVSHKQFAKAIIPDCVDSALFYLLHAIDTGTLHMSLTVPDGNTMDLTHEGKAELAGWYMGSDGWRAAYSQQRFVDDFKDLGETFAR